MIVKNRAEILIHKSAVLAKKLSEWSLRLTKGMGMIHPYVQDMAGPSCKGLGLVWLRNVACQKTWHGNSDKAKIVFQYFVSGKWIIAWKVINHTQVRLDIFELYQDMQVRPDIAAILHFWSGYFQWRSGSKSCRIQSNYCDSRREISYDRWCKWIY